MARFTRRQTLKIIGLGTAAALMPFSLARAVGQRRHGLSAFGDLKYPEGFEAFDYVRPDAPKGGRMSLVPSSFAFNQDSATFNTLNSFVLSGQSPVGMELTFDSLMALAEDEPDSYYGLVAESVSLSEDNKEAIFHLNPAARFHDGTSLTADDVLFSLDILGREGHTSIRNGLLSLENATRVGDDVRITVFGDFPISTLLFVVSLPIFSAQYWQDRSFTASTMEAPLGSGPYRVGTVRAGTSITFRRVEDYWGKDLPVNRGKHNFDEVRYDFFRDRDSAFTAFTANTYDLREEFTARTWATRYDFPAVRQGRVVMEELIDESPAGGQAWHFNTRREKFSDIRVREAIALAFDFEWANANLFHGLYNRTHSFFENSPMKAEDMPSEAELALLEPLRDELLPSVFEAAYTPPITDGTGRNRANLRRAATLLDEAGVRNDGGTRRLANGNAFEIEFLMADNGFLRIVEPYATNLRTLGIVARPRLVDASQYRSRVNEFDFDMITVRTAVPLSPSPALMSFFHSSLADVSGGRNVAGIRSDAVDTLVNHMLEAQDREAYYTAARALDRVLRASHFMVPQWFKGTHTIAYWNRFSRPETKPKFSRGIVNTWWYDAEKAASL